MAIEEITTDNQGSSPDLIAENVEALKSLFPEIVIDGKVDASVLLQLLGDEADESDEKFGLNWHGKRRARQLALTPSTGTLRPAPADSVAWETTQHLMIEGDNLEVLKLLQKSYSGRVKLIYIDPPYNSGGDFVYKDDFKDNIANYLDITGQTEEGRKVSTNTEASGRFHTDWLNMMYPRLKLARQLLRNDGVIFISIDDEEAFNLKVMADSIFGEENFVASIAWKKRASVDARTVLGSMHDWILCYVKSVNQLRDALGKLPLSEKRVKAYRNPDDDPRGPWASENITGMTGRAPKSQYYDIRLPSGRVIKPPEGRSWGFAETTFRELVADNRIWFGADGDNVPRYKKFLSESDGQAIPSFWDMKDVGSNDEAKKECNNLFPIAGVFDTPKPVRLMERMVTAGSKPGDIVLDFFAGSGTTGHAVMNINAGSEALSRRYILVQLPEPLSPEVNSQAPGHRYCQERGLPPVVSELTKERLRRAGDKIREEHPDYEGDLGFRVFKLDSSNIRAWDPQPEDLEDTLLEHVDHLKKDRSEQDVLYELLLKLGLDLCVPIETSTIANKTVHSIGAGTLFACLDETLETDKAEDLALGIVEWRDKLDPAGDTTVVFRDSAFPDDVTKTNLDAILKQHNITTVRSI